MKRIFIHLVLLISVLSISVLSLNASGRSLRQKGNLSLYGKVVDKSTGQVLPKVMVQLYSQADSTYVTGTVTDLQGHFDLSQLITGHYTVRFTYLGMKKYEKQVHLTSKQKAQSLGTIKMAPDAVQLNETVVTAEVAPVVLKGDTAVFSSAAYKLPEGAVVEDLLKRLPGVDIDEEGKITVNGKEVNKLLVDGKEFFSGNMDITLKNLTADIISNVKSYEKESDMAKDTGVKDGKEEQVLDISIKPEMKKGWFGDAELAQGNHDRYSYDGMANRFRGDDQYSVLFNRHNIQNQGIGGGAGRLGMRTPRGKEEGQLGGANISITRKNMELMGDVNGSTSDVTNASTTSSQSYYSTGTRFSESQINRLNKSKSISANFQIKLDIDSLTILRLMPNVSISNNESFGFGHTIQSDAPIKAFDWNDISTRFEPAGIFAEDTTQLVYQSYQTSHSESDNYSYALGGSFVRKSAKRKGRSFTVNFNVGQNKSDSESTSDTRTYYYRVTDNQYSPQVQRPVSDNKSYSYRLGAGYNEPVGKNKFLQLNYTYSRNSNDNERHVYDLLDADEIEIDSLHKTNKTTLENHYFDAAFNSQGKKLFYRLGMTVIAQNTHSEYNIGDDEYDQSQHVVNYAPFLRLRHTLSRNTRWEFSYRGRSRQPTIEQLTPVTDYSNPTIIKDGNPDLKPSFSHSVYGQYTKYVPKKKRSFALGVSATSTTNQITSRRIYDEETGVTRTKPMNINGNWSASLNYTFTTPLAKKHWTGSLVGYGMYYESPSYQMINKESLKSTTSQQFLIQRASVNYRTSSIELGVGGNVRYNKSENDLVSSTPKETFQYTGNANGLYRFPFGLSLAFDTNIINRDGYGEQEDGTDMVLNGQVAYSMLKGKALTFTLNAMDILHQRPTMSRNVYSSGERITRYDALTSYVLFSVKYRFNTMQSGKSMKSGRSRRFDRSMRHNRRSRF